MHKVSKIFALAALVAAVAGCGRDAPTEKKFDTTPVERRDIAVTVEASGTIEPLLTVEIKSKASGEVLKADYQTGALVKAGTLLVQIDKRTPRNNLAQAQADLEAAIAHRQIAKAQFDRSKELFKTRTINEVDYETNELAYANAKADVVRAQVSVENARITLDDTDVRAPITGTIIEKLVETGQVISSPMKDFGGGTSLMKMADLSTVQVRALVDETDVGKIRPGKPVIVKVTAYPNQPFPGTVDKIEPQAQQDQSVTTFAVLIRLPNPDGLLRPGMNADVDIRVAERANVLAVPTSTLRTFREIGTMAAEVGLDEATVRTELAGSGGAAGHVASDAPADAGRHSGGVAPPGRGARPQNAAPEGLDGLTGGYEYGGRYWTFVARDGKPVAVNVETGLTNLDYNEVISGLKEGDQVIMLPSAGLLQMQARGRQFMRRFSVMPSGGGGQKTARKRPSQGAQGGAEESQPTAGKQQQQNAKEEGRAAE